jgi:hypothetical protein
MLIETVASPIQTELVVIAENVEAEPVIRTSIISLLNCIIGLLVFIAILGAIMYMIML